MGFLTFLPFLLQEKGAEMATIGLVLSLIFAGGAAGKFICGVMAVRFGILRSVIVTEMMTTLCILAMIIFPLNTAIMVSPIIGIALNGTSSVLYGSVPELVSEERRQQAFAIFYTLTIGSGAISPSIYGVLSDFVGIKTAVVIVASIVLFTIPLTVPLRKKLI
jgi:MFS family permease